ncbi:hypothetical protein [Colwellia sp. RSH04]|uniref:hypothetical protein n=1 Tax=Colwellia sp. RSH04 TaxID=2305464 RepID=UPI000E5871AB|nr:hypothetical protein [Colwellia sp. RSH04]RHW74792.1 hypothetical protein D1094_16720 [Colwellia sp. RSH04]
MSIKKSPGQKRKKIVQIGVFLFFIITTYFAGQFWGSLSESSLSWVENHATVTATVTELLHEEEEYRNRKGRKRTKDVYSISYKFTVEGDEIDNTIEISSSQFNSIEEGSDIIVWYDSDDVYTNDTKENVESALASNNAVSNMFTVGVYTAPIALFLYWLLSIIFVRESKKSLPEGFYTETSWLDVDDKYMVALDGSELVYFDIDKSRISEVQQAYQNNASLEDLIGNSKSSKLKRIPLGEITELVSHHNSDVITIDYKGDSHKIEFLNQTVKQHALERIIKHIPTNLSYMKKERTRIQAAIPSFIWLLILVAVIYFVNYFLVNIVLGFYMLVSVLPKIISRLIDPTITQTWLIPTVSEEAVTE